MARQLIREGSRITYLDYMGNVLRISRGEYLQICLKDSRDYSKKVSVGVHPDDIKQLISLLQSIVDTPEVSNG